MAVGGIRRDVDSHDYAGWFSPQRLERQVPRSPLRFQRIRARAVSLQFTIWLGWALLVAGDRGRGREPICGIARWRGSPTGSASSAWYSPLITLYGISKIGADNNVDSANGPWQNLGSGGWLACMGFSLLATAGGHRRSERAAGPSRRSGRCAVTTANPDHPRTLAGRTARRTLMIGIAIALFFPPTMTEFWQKVLVSEIGVYVLLAIGLNVVVGWAGLLDLGYIAFYAIGSYTTAYLVGSLPHKPPSWLHMTPAARNPVRDRRSVCSRASRSAHRPCDCAATTSRSSPSASARSSASSLSTTPANITNSTARTVAGGPDTRRSTSARFHHWGLNKLQYWYLLLVLIIIVVILFYRLEGSRLGRAWAAIREDEVAAQATGINTTAGEAARPSRSARRPPVWPACSSPARSGTSTRTTSS